jgi:hypothetical protein
MSTTHPPDDFDGQAEGERRKENAHARFEATRNAILTHARRMLLLRMLEHGKAAVDEVREAIPVPTHCNPKLFGAVPGPLASAGIIARTGYRPTTRPEGHARPVSVWGLVDPGGAEAWLRNNPEPHKTGETTDRPRPQDEGPILF